MSTNARKINSVAIIGAGASGAAAAAALSAEKCFDRIKVFERREAAGGTWTYDYDPGPAVHISPGQLPPDADPPLDVPEVLPASTRPCTQERFYSTPVYADLMTNVPAIAMSFSDSSFPYGPFVPHWVPKQHVQNYFARHRTDEFLSFNTTVEDVTKLTDERWLLSLRRHDPVRKVDDWWREEFDALVLCNGHYTVPFIPNVPGLATFMDRYPGKVMHSKVYRTASSFSGKRVIVIGNSASGHDITEALVSTARHPVFQSRRSRSRWDDTEPTTGVCWKPVVNHYCPDTGDIYFADDTVLHPSEVDHIIYCTGYKPSFPFWNSIANGGPLWDYKADRLVGNYLHTFFRNHSTLGTVGMPKTLTFRSFEYQAIALARAFSGNAVGRLPSEEVMICWEEDRAALMKLTGKRFHDIPWDKGECASYLEALYQLGGLPKLNGEGLCPPILDARTRWEVENVKRYPEPGNKNQKVAPTALHEARPEGSREDWVIVPPVAGKDSLHYV